MGENSKEKHQKMDDEMEKLYRIDECHSNQITPLLESILQENLSILNQSSWNHFCLILHGLMVETGFKVLEQNLKSNKCFKFKYILPEMDPNIFCTLKIDKIGAVTTAIGNYFDHGSLKKIVAVQSRNLCNVQTKRNGLFWPKNVFTRVDILLCCSCCCCCWESAFSQIVCQFGPPARSETWAGSLGRAVLPSSLALQSCPTVLPGNLNFEHIFNLVRLVWTCLE
jgi:hypothetical protein